MLLIGTLLKLPSLTAHFVPFEGKRSKCSYDTTYKSLDVYTRGHTREGAVMHPWACVRGPHDKRPKKGDEQPKKEGVFCGSVFRGVSGYIRDIRIYPDLGSESGLNRN